MQDYPGKTYADYLKSDHWQYIRQQKWLHHKYECRICNDNSKLAPHHRGYEDIGRENIKDLPYLCRQCHHDVHFYSNGQKVELDRIELIAREEYLYHRPINVFFRITKLKQLAIYRVVVRYIGFATF